MKTFPFLALSYFSIAVWAGGYQGCLERVWAYQAYLIDGLNAPEDQTLGFRCSESNFDKATGDCRVDWDRCQPKTDPSGRCSYDEFIRFLRKAPMDKGWRVPETGPIDVEATAKKCYEVHKKMNRIIRNFTPYGLAKNQREFNALVIKISDVVNKAYREKKTAANGHLWESFDTTTDKIAIARTGDRTCHSHVFYSSLSDASQACPFLTNYLLPNTPF